jgi:hypothetical protein
VWHKIYVYNHVTILWQALFHYKQNTAYVAKAAPGILWSRDCTSCNPNCTALRFVRYGYTTYVYNMNEPVYSIGVKLFDVIHFIELNFVQNLDQVARIHQCKLSHISVRSPHQWQSVKMRARALYHCESACENCVNITRVTQLKCKWDIIICIYTSLHYSDAVIIVYYTK